MNSVISLRPRQFANQLANTPDAILLDVRTPEEFRTGHIEGAENLSFENDSFKIKVAKLDKNNTYFLCCRAGNRSFEFGQYLIKQGFPRVYNLENGIFS